MSRRRTNRELAHLAAELGPEDGGDPKEFHGKPWQAPKTAGRKSLQLCQQVKNALHSALAACGDEVLQALSVASVKPAPNTSRLLVVAIAPEGADSDKIVRHLERATGKLRTDAAAAICRRFVPELAFEVMV